MQVENKHSNEIFVLTEFKKHRVYKYCISIVIVIVASYLQYFLWPWIEPAPWILFYPAVIIASLYGDGTSAILLSIVLGQLYFVKPYGEMQLNMPDDLLRIGLFLLAALLMRTIVRNMTLSKLKADSAVAMLLSREQDLKLEKDTREKFVSTLNHDLQNPLAAIKISSQMIARKTDSEAVSGYVQKQLKSINRMEQMIANLLDANRIQAGKPIPLHIENLDLPKLIHATVHDLEILHGKRFVVKSKNSIKGFWSEDAIRRILENLCSNAVKYGNEKDIIIEAEETPSSVLIHVNNKGPVISEADQLNLFDAYKRTSTAIESSTKGWGLGLALVKGLTDAQGGSVKVTSNDKIGTTFTVFLPKDARSYANG